MTRKKLIDGLYELVEPIESVDVALDLLYHRWGDGSTRDLRTAFRRHHGHSFIEVGYHKDFSDSTYYRYRVVEPLVSKLRDEHLVRGQKKWGYTDMHELSISEAGAARLARTLAEQDLSFELGRFVDSSTASWRVLLERGVP